MQQSSEITETAAVLDGTKAANALKEELRKEVEGYINNGKRPPGLAVLLIGDDPASHVYVKNKVLACKKVGIESRMHELPSSISAEEVFSLIDQLNKDPNIDGILVQLPLPKRLPTEAVLMAVAPEKDADGLHPYNLGLLFSGKKGLRPCTPSGIMFLLERHQIAVEGKHAVVIGRSNLVGKPIAAMLLEKNATVTICHSKSKDLKSIARSADILVVAAGKPEMVRGDWIKPGATVIDVGIHRVTSADGTNKLTGDVFYAEAKTMAANITPVPGGVGPMTVALLLANTVESYRQRNCRNKD